MNTAVSRPLYEEPLHNIEHSQKQASGISLVIQGSHLSEKTAFLRKKRAGYTNPKMPYVYCTQKTVTSHIKMRLVFSFFAPSREGL